MIAIFAVVFVLFGLPKDGNALAELAIWRLLGSNHVEASLQFSLCLILGHLINGSGADCAHTVCTSVRSDTIYRFGSEIEFLL